MAGRRPRLPAAEWPQIEYRFRIFDGTDLCQGIYPLSTTIDAIKERLLSEWPQDKSIIPTSVDDIRLLHAGHYLVSGRTLGESRLCIVPDEVVTMHVIVQPPEASRRRTVGTNQDPTCCNSL